MLIAAFFIYAFGAFFALCLTNANAAISLGWPILIAVWAIRWMVLICGYVVVATARTVVELIEHIWSLIMTGELVGEPIKARPDPLSENTSFGH